MRADATVFGPWEAGAFHWVFLPIVLLWMSWRWCGGVRQLAFVSWFVVVWIVLIHLQAFPIYERDLPSFRFLLSVWAAPVIVIATAALGLHAVGHTPARIREAFDHPVVSIEDHEITRWTPVLTALLVATTFLYILDIGIGNVALFFLITSPGSGAESMILRIIGMHSRLHPALTVFYSYGRALFFPAYAALLGGLAVRGLITRSHAGLAIGAVAVFSLLTAAKAPMAFMLIGVVLSVYTSRRGRVSRRVLVAISVVALAIPAAIYPLIQGVGGWEGVGVAITNLWRRLTWVTSYTSAAYFDAFPALHPFRGLESNRVLALLAGTDYSSTASWVYERYMPSTIPGGTANASYVASFYADWGMSGVILGSILVGATLAGLQVFFDTRAQDTLSTAARAVCLVAASQLMMTNFYSVAMGRGLLTLPVLLLGLTWGLGALHLVRRPMPVAPGREGHGASRGPAAS